MERAAGILLPVFSLPSRYGIGSLGKEAYAFIDFLSQAGQRWWQVLPVGPAGAGNSPYSSVSTFAGDPLLIDLEELVREGLLDRKELQEAELPAASQIDYPAVAERKKKLLRRAFQSGGQRLHGQIEAFTNSNVWVKNYALYISCKEYYHGESWLQWQDDALRRRTPEAVAEWSEKLSGEIAYHTFVQLLFFRQWERLRQYAHGAGIQILGDLPIYVSLDSADVWGERREFLLRADGYPEKIAGVPPDYFSQEGQLWGNPLYDWEAMRTDGFGWWIRRVAGASRLYDAIRIDHFRGLESYWAVPFGAETAKAGAWEQGPGMDLLRVLTDWFPQVSYVAEDLGILTPEVGELRRKAGLPGMKVLEFAFSGADNAYLPHNYPDAHCICYTGTHDNDTAMGWWSHAGEQEREFARRYLGMESDREIVSAMLRCGQGSVAELFVAQMQDYLQLGSEARMNVPGVANGNWRWRLQAGQLTPELAVQIRQLTETYGRCAKTHQ